MQICENATEKIFSIQTFENSTGRVLGRKAGFEVTQNICDSGYPKIFQEPTRLEMPKTGVIKIR